MSTIAPGEVRPPAPPLRVQARVIAVRAGLQIIRYVTTRGADDPPVVRIQPMPEDGAHVVLMSSTEGDGFTLDEPGDVIVVKAMRDVRLVASMAAPALCADAAVLRIERIGGREQVPCRPAASTATVELIQPKRFAGEPPHGASCAAAHGDRP